MQALIVAACAFVLAVVFGKLIIPALRALHAGQSIREIGPSWHNSKAGTPTMGGVIILISILIPTLLFGDLTNVYTRLMIVSTVWLGLIGFLDDYIKIVMKRSEGLNPIAWIFVGPNSCEPPFTPS